MARLVLLGVVHGDPLGESRLLDRLRGLRPAVVTLEVAEFSVAFRHRHGPRLRALLDRRLAGAGLLSESGPFEWLRRYLDVPFEWTGAERFSRETGSEILSLGDARDAAKYLDLVEDELLSPGNLLRLAFGDAARDPEAERRRARLLLDEPARYVFAGERHALESRDARVAEEIRRRLRALGEDAVLAHVGGWEHLVERSDLPNLAAHLRDLEPERVLV